jgi:hypothetical protein
MHNYASWLIILYTYLILLGIGLPADATDGDFLACSPNPKHHVTRITDCDDAIKVISSGIPKLLPRQKTNSQVKPKLYAHRVAELIPRFQLQPRGNGMSRYQTGYPPPTPPKALEVQCLNTRSTKFCSTYCDCHGGRLTCMLHPLATPESLPFGNAVAQAVKLDEPPTICFRSCECVEKRQTWWSGFRAAKREDWEII